MNYFERATQCQEELVANRRWLHQHPERGFALEQTVPYVRERLLEIGLEPQDCGSAGLTATIGRGGKAILLRADMDALPLREQSGLPFAADGEFAHACGHDMHTAMLLCAARLLRENEAVLPGTVKLMFQPAEELLEGAKSMIAADVLDNPKVDAALALHMLPGAPTGMIGYNTGTVSASSDSFAIDVHGKGGHGAMPQNTVDPIHVGVHIHLALQALISRETDPAQQAVLSIGSFQAGGVHNIIPESARLLGTLRTFNEELRATLQRRIVEVCEHTAAAFRAGATVEFLAAAPSLQVDEALAAIIAPALTELFGADRVLQLNQTLSGSEDFAEISLRVPTFFFALGAGTAQEGYTHPLHHPQVTFNEEALPVGAAALAQGAHAWLRHAAETL